jgi:hypothetical protein
MRMGTVPSPDLLPNTQHAEHYRDRSRALGGHHQRHRHRRRDATPDTTSGPLDRAAPGIAEALRASGLATGALHQAPTGTDRLLRATLSVNLG